MENYIQQAKAQPRAQLKFHSNKLDAEATYTKKRRKKINRTMLCGCDVGLMLFRPKLKSFFLFLEHNKNKYEKLQLPCAESRSMSHHFFLTLPVCYLQHCLFFLQQFLKLVVWSRESLCANDSDRQASSTLNLPALDQMLISGILMYLHGKANIYRCLD